MTQDVGCNGWGGIIVRRYTFVFLSLVLFSQIANALNFNADPFRLKWRQEKLATEEILQRIKVGSLLGSSGNDVREYLSKKNASGETKMELLADELKASTLKFTEVTPTNPDGHNPDLSCAYSEPKAKAPIVISKTDCGELKSDQIRQTLIKSTLLHFGDIDDELSDYVSVAIVDSYNVRAATDASFSLYDRYRDSSTTTNPTILKINVASKKVTGLSGGLDLNLSGLPVLSGHNGTFRTRGEYDSFGCRTWTEGIGKNPDGSLGYGELEGTSRRHSVPLKASIEIQVLPRHKMIHVEGSYEVKASKCEKADRFFSFTMDYYPPTTEEMEAARLAKNTNALFTLLNSPLSEASPERQQRALELMAAGIRNGRTEEILRKAIAQKYWDLVNKSASELPADQKLPDILFSAIQAPDVESLKTVLALQAVSSRLDFEAKQNYVTPVGAVLAELYKDAQAPTLEEDRAVAKLDALLGAGAPVTGKITDIVNVPPTALSSAVARWRIAPKVVDKILSFMDQAAVMKPDSKDRTAMDYLTLHWEFFNKNCKASAQNNEEGKANFDKKIADYNAVYSQLVAKGHDGKRRGCIYYRTRVDKPACEYDPKTKGFRINFATDYHTKPWNERRGSNSSLTPEFCG
jgi:hypothetical protein